MICTVNRYAATALLGIITSSLIAAPASGMGERSQTASGRWRAPLEGRQKLSILLSRITFGLRPGDLVRVEQMGLNTYLERQLHPENLDDSALDVKLRDLGTLEMSPAELAANFPPPRHANRFRVKRLALFEQPGEAMKSPAGTQDQAASMTVTAGEADSADAASSEMEASAPLPQGPRAILIQLGQEELLRAAYSRRQLQEVMVHFWMNHFNIYWPKGAGRYYLTAFEQNVIRPRALGNFEDLLVATAKSPAMLFYLDNWVSVSPDLQNQPGGVQAEVDGAMPAPGTFGVFGMQGSRRFPQARTQKRRGLNENYGRELMELHTIGLHYTQRDVTEVARCFTGWTIRRPRLGGGFYFNPRLHDYGQKIVLGHTIPAGHGIEDGLEVLHILATSPDTAHHIAYEVCQHFVADDPPAELVNEAARTYLRTRGDIRSMLRTILTSSEFYSQAAYEAKVKSPFEYVASALRALGAQTDGSRRLLGLMAQMGEPMFLCQAPSGYSDVASTWINSSALLARMNFAIALCLGHIPGTIVDWQSLTKAGETSRGILEDLANELTGSKPSPATENAILSRWGDGGAENRLPAGRELAMMTALLIASPEFQRR